MSASSSGTVLLLGATGLIGSHLKVLLEEEGFKVRTLSRSEHPEMDFSVCPEVAAWLPYLVDVHSVINAVGIFRERGSQTFASIHESAPRNLFEACALAGVRHVVQVSALGAQTGVTKYFRTKHRADEHLARLPAPWTVVQPSLVYAVDGRSARFFNMLASLPVLPLPSGGCQQIQPIHIFDVAAGIVALVKAGASCRRIPFVGPETFTLRQFLASLRVQLDLGALHVLPLPDLLGRMLARMGTWLRFEFLNADSMRMLQAGNKGDPGTLASLLGRPLVPVGSFIGQERQPAAREAILGWTVPLLRVCIAGMWIWSGVTSLWLYPEESSHELLERTPLPGATHELALVAGGVIDIGLGLAALCLARVAWLWRVQIVVVVIYTAIISVWLPELWLHPFGPVLKNIPVLAALVLLYYLERPWNTS